MKNFTPCWRRSSCLLYIFLIWSTAGFAAPLASAKELIKPVAWTISGKVIDRTGLGLPGVTVVVKGTATGTATGADGTYTLSVPETPGTLVFSFIGFVNQEIPYNGPGTYNLTLTEDAKALEEVVVIGYGTQRKEDLTGSVAAISEKDFNPGQITTPEQLISGRVAGVQITSNSGAPGGGSRIRIRGGSSLNASNDPLIVIDGVPLDNNTVSGAANPLSLINPNDIESFNILKDASAAAIYGSRASNGVIIITTKKGKADDKFQVSFGTVTSVAEITETVDVLTGDEFRAVVNQYATPANRALLGSANTNWQDLIYQRAFTSDNNLTFSGGLQNIPYRLSVGYLDQDGIILTSNVRRTSAALNLSPKFLDDHLSINLSLKGAYTQTRFAEEAVIGTAVSFDPTQPAYQPGNSFGGFFEWTRPDGTINTLAPRNPLSILEQRQDLSDVKRSIGNLQLDYRLHFLPALRANLNVGYDVSDTDGATYLPATLGSVFLQGGSDYRYAQNRKNGLLDFYLNYTKDLAGIKSRIDATAGYSYQSFHTTEPQFPTFNLEGQVITQPKITNEFKNVLIGFFGRLNYTFRNRYLLTANIRRDGSSRFGPNTRWGTFPSLALGWRLIEEPFLSSSLFFSDLKLRAGYGQTGQQDIGFNSQSYYPYLARYAYSNTEASYQLGNQFYSTLRPAGYDENIKWEETVTYNAGLDFGFVGNRLNGSLDYYFKKTEDLIAEIQVPAGSNLTNRLFTNVGNIENKGVEAVLNFNVINTERVKWDVGVNGTYNENKITKLSKVSDENAIGYQVGAIGGGVGNTIQVRTVGYARDVFYVYKQVYDETGQPIERTYADLNGDGVVNAQDLYRYKQPDPKVFLGFNSQVSYGNWNLGAVLRANLGNYVYNNLNANAFYNNIDWEGYLLTIPSSVRGHNFVGEQPERLLSDYFIENGSFLRLDNVNLGYNFGRIFNDRVNIRLSASGQNVFTVTKYSGVDPEVASGINNNFYPRPRLFSLGVNLDF